MTTTDEPQGLNVAPGALNPRKGRTIQLPASAYPGDPLPGAVALKAGVRAWLAARGLDPAAPDVVDTPDRVLRALNEMTAGYDEDPAQHLARTFPAEHAGTPIVVTGVPFTSLCAHHLLPFTGHADIAYQPRLGDPVAGLSKLPRVLDVYARRLQTQEDLTRQVTAALDEHLAPLGAACVIRSEHGCLAHRGARKPGAVMVTASYTGCFDADPYRREELHRLMSG
ncbi:GTP cyclohydrolase I [Streptomyces sp. SAI-127]|uniref:GTP cyclohydrolase I n=1 Tax=Streptomyces sp. SAI-127 TaxID=2940543 RepID=UPI0024751BD5|nr:GTP cyclohydrolase I [Streptomyces sp. SAI-127]MDH6489645.1 GTP cyclohydrolase I [Streptomyces sp. SAI-127]